MFNPMRQPMSQSQIMQQIQRLQANPMQMLQQAGFSIPQGMNDPNAIIRHMEQTGQIQQGQYSRFVQMMQKQRF